MNERTCAAIRLTRASCERVPDGLEDLVADPDAAQTREHERAAPLAHDPDRTAGAEPSVSIGRNDLVKAKPDPLLAEAVTAVQPKRVRVEIQSPAAGPARVSSPTSPRARTARLSASGSNRERS
jgi:hypothetical protein